VVSLKQAYNFFRATLSGRFEAVTADAALDQREDRVEADAERRQPGWPAS
jgi:4'-phosphopantetheinyl transferase EntD